MRADDQLASLRAPVHEASRLRAAYAADRDNEEAFFRMVRALLECHSAACTLLAEVDETRREATPAAPEVRMAVEGRRNVVPGRDRGLRDVPAFQRAMIQLWADCAAALAGERE